MYQVLLVDGDTRAATRLQQRIDWKKHDCTVAGIADGIQDTMYRTQGRCPDIVFSEVSLPDGNGFDLLALLRSRNPGLRAVILTSCDDIHIAQQAFRFEVERYLLKPFQSGEVEEALEHMLTRPCVVPCEEAMLHGAEATNLVVRQATAYIMENCTRNLSLQEVARVCCVSKWHLSKLLSGNGCTFYVLLNRGRIDRAKTLLADCTLHIGDIASMVGYRDASHFGRIFKSLVGMPASEYRNELL